MRRADLAHLLRAAARIADPEILVIGSQAIHGAFAEHDLPPLAMVSREADIAFWNDEQDLLADRLDGAIGELSMFDQTHGYYAQGVSVATAILPEGWRGRVVPFEHDFVQALLEANLLDAVILDQRAESLPITRIQISTIRRFLKRHLPTS